LRFLAGPPLLCRKQRKGLWRDDRAAVLDRVAELAGDRFSWLMTCAEEAASLGADEVAGDR
jgi:hypothetical protein